MRKNGIIAAKAGVSNHSALVRRSVGRLLSLGWEFARSISRCGLAVSHRTDGTTGVQIDKPSRRDSRKLPKIEIYHDLNPGAERIHIDIARADSKN